MSWKSRNWDLRLKILFTSTLTVKCLVIWEQQDDSSSFAAFILFESASLR